MGLASSASSAEAVWGEAVGWMSDMKFAAAWDWEELAVEGRREFRPAEWGEEAGGGREGDGEGVRYFFSPFLLAETGTLDEEVCCGGVCG